MLTVAALIKMAFSLGLSLTFQWVTPEETVSQYYNEEKNIIVNCIPVMTDLGRASVCPMGDKDAIVYIVRE